MFYRNIFFGNPADITADSPFLVIESYPLWWLMRGDGEGI